MCFLQAKYMSCHGYVIFLFHLLQGICIIRVVLIYHLFTSYIVCSQENTCVDQLLGTSIFWHRMVFKLMSHCKTIRIRKHVYMSTYHVFCLKSTISIKDVYN